MSETADVVVLGLGGMGASALFHLAARGVSVVGIEQHGVPHTLGSSHGSSRVIRKAYFEDARYVPIIERSYALWRELEQASGAALYTRTGCVNLGPADHADMRSLVDTVKAHALAHELLDARALRARFPLFCVDDDVMGVFEEDAGVLHPERCTATHVALAVQAGARVHMQERVLAVNVSDTGVEVTTSARTISCGHVVVAAGPWLPELAQLVSPRVRTTGTTGTPTATTSKMEAGTALQRIARSLHVTRQVQLWFEPAIAALPVFIEFIRDGRAYYGMPPLGGDGVKICRHGGGVRTTPDDVDRVLHEADVDDVRGYLRAHMPALADAPVVRSAVCMYTMTPDAHFVVGRAGERVVVLGGFSGHGYKMASAIGESAAELVVVDGAARLDLSLFDPARL